MRAFKPSRLKPLLLALAMIFTLSLSSAAPVFAAGAAADYTPPSFGLSQDLSDLLHAHQYYLWLRSCFQDDDIDKISYANNEMQAWGWFREGANAPQLVGNSEGADGAAIVKCDNDSAVGTAFNLLGFTDAATAFCNIAGAKFNNGDGYPKPDECIANPEQHDWDNDGVSSTDVRKSFETLVQTTDQGKAAAATASPAMQYLRYLISVPSM
jgi:hypothetical protein